MEYIMFGSTKGAQRCARKHLKRRSRNTPAGKLRGRRSVRLWLRDELRKELNGDERPTRRPRRYSERDVL